MPVFDLAEASTEEAYTTWILLCLRRFVRVTHAMGQCIWKVLLALGFLLGAITGAMAASPACTAVNSGQLNYSGQSPATQLGVVVGTFYPGDQLFMTYTSSGPKSGVVLDLILTSVSVNTVVTGASGTTQSLTATVGALLPIGAQAGIVDATAALNPRTVTLTVTCNPAAAPATLALSSAINPTVYGQAGTLAATVGSVGGTPTGDVVFVVDGVAQPPVALSNGVATLGTASLVAGNHTVSASYAGNASFSPASATLSGGHTVSKAATATAVTTSAASAPFGSAITFTATTTATAPGTGAPTGSMVFTIDGVDQAPATLSNGVATLTTSGLGVGNHTVAARYLASANYLASSASLAGGAAITKTATSTAVSQSAVSTSYGQSTTFTAAVTSASGAPSGTVIFTIDGVAHNPVPLAGGAAEFSTATLAVGTHSVSAAYAGSSTMTSSSGTLTPAHTVMPIITTTTLTGPGPIVYGNNATITATVAAAGSPPTGSIVFTVDGVDHAPVALVNGAATVTLTAPLSGTHSVAASYAGSATHSASSGTIAGGQVVQKAATTTAIGVIAQVSVGQSVNLNATVSSAAGTPDGSVVFTVDGVDQAPVLLAGGQANLLVSGLGVGSHTILASYSSASNFGPSSGTATATVGKATSSILVNSSANPAVTGQGLVLTATMSSPIGTPTGAVIFSIDGIDQPAQTITNGTATLAPPALAVGHHSIVASYAGSSTMLASSASLPGGQTADRAQTTVILSSDSLSAPFGSAVRLQAAVAPVAPGAGTPGGSVVFSIDGVDLPPVSLNAGLAVLERDNFAVGTHAVTALYVGDSGYTPASGALAGGQAIAAAPTTTTLAVSPAHPTLSGTATVTATVGTAAGVPTGSVIFTVNGVDRAPQPLINGSAQLLLPSLAVGDLTIGSRFMGSTNYQPSSATDTTISTAPAPTVTTVSASSLTSRFGEAVTVSAAVTADYGSPIGSVEFRADGVLVGTASLANGTASLSTSALSIGAHAITASYLGSADHAASTGALAAPVNVGAGTTNLALAATPQPAQFGDHVILTATASALAGTPAGMLTFSIDGVAQTPIALANGGATLVLTGLEPGIHTVSASYAGWGDHLPVGENLSGGIEIIRAPVNVVLTSSPATPVFGDAITVAATLTSSGGTPTGDVIFTVDGTAQPARAAVGGVASLSLTGLGAGPHSINAHFAGETRFAAADGALPGGITVAVAATSMTVTAAPDPAVFGAPVTLSATVTATPGPPSGNVVFTIDGVAQTPVALAGGVASFTTAGLTVGPHAIGASYAAQDSFAASSATLTGGLEVDLAPTQLSLTGPATAPTLGDTVPFVATVSSANGSPSGMVVFSVDGVDMAPVPLAGGQASLNQVFATAGSHSVVATYLGNASFGPSSDMFTTSVAKAVTTTTLTAPGSAEFGATVTLSAAVSASAGTPSGVVTILLDGAAYGSATLSNGTASLTLPALPTGVHRIAAAYAGTANFAPSSDTGADLTVTAAASSVQVTVGALSVTAGEPVSIIVTATSQNGPATGSVTITVGANDHAVPLQNGVATLMLGGLAAGTYPVSAVYPGNANFAPSSGTLVPDLVVDPAPSDIHVAANLPRSVAGAAYAGGFTAFGGVGPYVFAVTGGGLPPGLTLDPASGAISGTPATAGTYGWDITATGAAGAPGVYQAQLTVLAPATLLFPASVADAAFGEAYSASVAVGGGTAPYAYALTAGALLQGLQLDAATGAITGTPTQLGPSAFTVSATDANGFSARQTYTMTVTAPVIAVTGTFGTAVVSAPFSATPTANGGVAPYLFSADASLPAGLVLSTVTGAISGTPTQAGHYDFGVVAIDSNGFEGRLAVALDIAVQPIIVLPPNLADARENRPYEQLMAATGGTAPYAYSVTSGALPPGLTLNAATGRFAGTPTVGGSFTFEITATDGSTRAGSRSYTLVVQPAATLTVGPALLSATAGVAFSQTLAASGGTAPYRFAIASGALPSGIALDPATGTLSGTALLPGTYGMVLDVTDAGGDTLTTGLTLQVMAPTITVSANLVGGAFGDTLTGTVAASGGTAPYSYNVTAGALPDGITLDPATGALGGTAAAAGTFHAMVSATDGNGFSGAAPIDVTVASPTLTLGTLPAQFMVGRTVAEMIPASGGRAPYAFTTSGNLPAGLLLDPATGALSGVPSATGLRHFTITATDVDGFSVSATFTMEIVTDVGSATLPASLAPATAGAPYTESVAATGGAAPLSYAITSGSLPTGLTLDLATSAIAGTTLQTGDFAIAVTATGTDGRTNTASYVLHVAAPVLAAAGTTMPDAVGGTAYSQTVPVSGGTVPYHFALQTGALPPGLTLDAAGQISGTPTAAGSFPFVVTVTDDNGFANDLAFNLSVTAPGIAVMATPPAGRVGLAYSATIAAGGGTAPYHFAVTGGALPDGVTLDGSTGTLAGTPGTTGVAVFTVTVTATDAYGFTGAASFDLTVNSNAGTATLPAGIATPVIGQAYSQSVAASGGTAPYNYHVGAGSLPPGLSLDAAGTIVGTPLVSGSYSFVIAVADAQGLVNHQTYGVTIAVPVIDLQAVPPPATVGAPYAVTITVTGGIAPYLYELEDAPPGIGIDPATGTVSGVPTTPGTHHFTVLVTDDYGLRAARRLTMIVAPAPVVLALPASLPDGTENVPYGASLTPTNAVGAITYSLANGTQLPNGLRLDNGAIRGTPTTPGTYSFAVHAEDADGNVGYAAYTVAIAAQPVVTAAATTAQVAASATSVVVGEVFTVAVEVSTVGGVADEGTVSLLDQVGGTTLATAALAPDGTAHFSLSFDDAANRTLVARYAGTPRFAPVDSSGVAIAVAPAATSVALAGAVASVPAGTPISLVAAATRTAPATGAAGPGTIHLFVDGIEQSVQPAINGAAAYLVTPPPGQHRLRAVYVPSGTDNLGSDTESDVLVTSATTTALSGPTGTLPEGQTLTYTATVAPTELGAAPGGTVTFSDNGHALATVPLAGNSASYTLTAPARGGHAITAAFSGDMVYGASSTPPIQANVVAVPTSQTASATTLSVDDPTPQLNEPITVTATVVGDGIAIPTGTVTFADADTGVVFGTATVDGNGLAVLTLALIDDTTTTIIGTYSGDAAFLASSGSTIVDPVVAATATVLTVSHAAVSHQGTVLLQATVHRRFGGLPGAGTIAFMADGIAFAHVPTNGSAPVTAVSDRLSDATVFSAQFIPGPSSADAPSVSAPVSVRVINAVPSGTLSLTLRADSEALFAVGQSIAVTAVIGSEGGPVTQIHLVSGLALRCPQTSLLAGAKMVCTGVYRVTDTDLATGQVTFAATARAADADPVSAQLVLQSAVQSISQSFAEMTESFVADRTRVLGNSIPLPNILARRQLGSRAGNVAATHDEGSQTLGFATSLAELRHWAAVQASDDLALGMLEEPLPFNIWVDANYSIHAASGDTSRWGSLGSIAIGLDYLLTKDILAGVMLQGDWATEASETGTVQGTGFLVGPYVSIALDDHLSLDATVLYGSSANTATATLFANAFSGDFDTTRLYAKGALTGYLELDKLTLRPAVAFGLNSEWYNGYQVSNAVGDMVAVPGGRHGQLQLTVGSSAEYSWTLDNGITLRPSVGFDFGFTRGLEDKAAAVATIIGSLTAGLQIETAAGFLMRLSAQTDIASDHFVSSALRVSVKGNF